MTDDARYGLEYLVALLRPHGLAESWCYLGADGSAAGMSRDELADRCRDADLYINLSNVNAIDEGRTCRRRVLVDTDPVFTQIGGHGLDDLASYDVRFTFGENIGRPGTSMPNGGLGWPPPRQPV